MKSGYSLLSTEKMFAERLLKGFDAEQSFLLATHQGVAAEHHSSHRSERFRKFYLQI